MSLVKASTSNTFKNSLINCFRSYVASSIIFAEEVFDLDSFLAVGRILLRVMMESMEKIEFSKYAELQAQERRIKKQDILDTLKSPGQVLLGKKGRKIAQKKLNREGEKGLIEFFFFHHIRRSSIPLNKFGIM